MLSLSFVFPLSYKILWGFWTLSHLWSTKYTWFQEINCLSFQLSHSTERISWLSLSPHTVFHYCTRHISFCSTVWFSLKKKWEKEESPGILRPYTVIKIRIQQMGSTAEQKELGKSEWEDRMMAIIPSEQHREDRLIELLHIYYYLLAWLKT